MDRSQKAEPWLDDQAITREVAVRTRLPAPRGRERLAGISNQGDGDFTSGSVFVFLHARLDQSNHCQRKFHAFPLFSLIVSHPSIGIKDSRPFAYYIVEFDSVCNFSRSNCLAKSTRSLGYTMHSRRLLSSTPSKYAMAAASIDQ